MIAAVYARKSTAVRSITITPTATGWDIEGGLDFEPILRPRVIAGGSDAPLAGNNGSTGGPDMAPHTPHGA